MTRRLLFVGCAVALTVTAQSAPRYEVDPSWPAPLPERWITGQLGGVCVDAHDHIAVVNRRNMCRAREFNTALAESA